MGNAAIGRGAVKAGVSLACGYPGTPSSEILSAVAASSDPARVHVEWSVNEKAAMEIAAGAAYAGARTLVTMKMVGLNVASDPLMSLAYVGVKGALVVVSADDPGPISSQTEQDSRAFGDFARIPVFDPATPEEAYEMIQDAFACSEKWHTPVLFRPTTRVCHAYAAIPDEPLPPPPAAAGFAKDPLRWVIFPKFSRMAHERIERRNPEIGKEFSSYRFQSVEGSGRKAVFAGGVSWAYAKDFLATRPADAEPARLVRIATPHPFPDDFALAILRETDEVLAFEELSPYLERELLRLAGQHHLPVRIRGKRTGDGILAGENGIDTARKYIGAFLGDPPAAPAAPADGALAPPPRPPVL
ncbi:MAG: indolepyruvate ferredoxin oxidoreductase subunit alpha, partial [Kiritimatiellae bacterium]|nr:indolepyruvate ferredoxin oxidoreductase subunit alpha [Kiritimatiellia bacterium]